LNLATALLFALGVILTLRRQSTAAQSPGRVFPIGRMFFAIPLGLFGLQHFAFLNEVKNGVPSWVPGHVFWACLVGAALIAACMSILTEIEAGLAGFLLGCMLVLFVLMLYLPFLINNPHDRFAITGPFRDLAMSGGALSLAGALGVAGRRPPIPWLATVGRLFFASSMLCFGVDHILHPNFAPGVPSPIFTPAWIPLPLALDYGIGAIFLVCGGCILVDKGARGAAISLGVTFLVLVACIYLPMEFIHPSVAISGELDEVAEKLAMSGAALLVAGALTKRAAPATNPL
jgi:uncharacterized membrane protein